MQFYVEKLSHSREFRDFMRKNPGAYLCSGFFVIDKEGDDNKQHVDFFLPKIKRISSFQMEDGIKEVSSELIDDKVPNKISEYKFEFEDIEDMIEKEMEKNNIKNKIQKLIFSLRNFEGKDDLTCTVFISMLGMLKVSIDISKKEITDFEKKSVFEILKVHRD